MLELYVAYDTVIADPLKSIFPNLPVRVNVICLWLLAGFLQVARVINGLRIDIDSDRDPPFDSLANPHDYIVLYHASSKLPSTGSPVL